MAGLDVFVDVLDHGGPPVALEQPFLGLVDSVMSQHGVAMCGLDGCWSHRGRKHEQHTGRFVRRFESSPEDAVIDEAGVSHVLHNHGIHHTRSFPVIK